LGSKCCVDWPLASASTEETNHYIGTAGLQAAAYHCDPPHSPSPRPHEPPQWWLDRFRRLACEADKGGPEAAAWARALYELALADAEADLLDRYPSESLIPGFDDEELPVLPARPPAVAAFCRPPPAGPPQARVADDDGSSGGGGRLMWLMRGLEGVPLGVSLGAVCLALDSLNFLGRIGWGDTHSRDRLEEEVAKLQPGYTTGDVWRWVSRRGG